MIRIVVAIAGCLFLAGCGKAAIQDPKTATAEQSAPVENKVKEADKGPEAKVAAVLEAFQASAKTFTAQRQEVVQARQRSLGEEQMATARLAADTERTLAVWRLSQSTDLLKLYADLKAQTGADGAAYDALEKLDADRQSAVDAAKTKVKLDDQKLSAARKALITLASGKSIEEQIKFYYEFFSQTRKEIDKLNAQKDAPAP